MRFVLTRKKLRIAVDQAKTKGGGLKVDPAGNPVYFSKPPNSTTPKSLIRRLSRVKRANLLLANACFQDLRSAQKLAALPHMKRQVRKLAKGANVLQASYEKEIGVEWTSILHSTRTYSGMSVETLAKLMGKHFVRWYESIYHFQSINVHAGDPLRHLTVTDDEKLRAVYVASDRELWQALTPAITMFFIVIDTLHKSVDYGSDVDHAYDSIKRRYKAILAGPCRPPVQF